ncbi:hypothetical protein WR25_16529 [Diploscapter pachys]|uniref:MAM domain-containing protein n=1 Tax=Diploscapter pachys TaxID=2018661 RepID=A0A2A2KVJ2_9BILA|nr:hypothetical protein WR25_16529 [Diploscapter pachys]
MRTFRNMRNKWFWKSSNLDVQACAIDATSGADIECQTVYSMASPSPVGVSFHKASRNFMLAIRVIKNLDTNSDSVVIVDSINYSATLCTDALSAFDLGQDFVSTPMLSILLNRNIRRAEDLNCDFSRRGVSCLWGWMTSGEYEDNEIAETKWTVGHGPLNDNKFRSLTGSTVLPDGEFALARLETGGSSLLFSEMVRCVLTVMTVEFDLWLTGSAGLQVCLLEASTPVLFDCQPLQTGHIIVDLPALNRPFRIALRATAEDQGLAIVDNIKVKGNVCPTSARQYSSKSFHPPAADQPDPNVCRLLACDFKQKGHPCLYESAKVPNGDVYRASQYGLSVQLNREKKVAILESSPFHLNTICRLHFNYQLEGDALLFVCNDSGAKELENCFKVDGRQGDDYIELLPSDTKLYMIARLNGTSGSLHLFNAYLSDSANVKC